VSVRNLHIQSVAESYYLAWFRLFVGDLSNDVSDDVLSNAFNKYTSFQKARVIRDRLSQKVCLSYVVVAVFF
jgi:RNA recognition motif-containing protein